MVPLPVRDLRISIMEWFNTLIGKVDFERLWGFILRKVRYKVIDLEDLNTLRRVNLPNSRYIRMGSGFRVGTVSGFQYDNNCQIYLITERLYWLEKRGYLFQDEVGFGLSNKGRSVLSALDKN